MVAERVILAEGPDDVGVVTRGGREGLLGAGGGQGAGEGERRRRGVLAHRDGRDLLVRERKHRRHALVWCGVVWCGVVGVVLPVI